MREVDPEELLRVCPDPFVRHQVDPVHTARAWVRGAAAVVDGVGGRPGVVAQGPVYTAVGPPQDLRPLLDDVARHAPRPWRVNTTGGVPSPWPRADEVNHWEWMLTRTEPPVPTDAPGVVVESDPDVAEIDAVLDVANPGSFGRPGRSAHEQTWLGIRVAGGLAATGAVEWMPDGTGHLRGVSVLPQASGRGLGTALSAALTRLARSRTGVATLGVYSDNARALRIYRRLGYEVVHSFVSGAVRSSTSAAEPSR